MNICAHPGCDEHAPGYDEFCTDHLPSRWKCEDCGCSNRFDEAFCFVCGAGMPEEES